MYSKVIFILMQRCQCLWQKILKGGETKSLFKYLCFLRILSRKYYMAKGTRKTGKITDKAPCKTIISKSKLRQMMKSTVKGIDPLRRMQEKIEQRVQRLIDEENLTCSVCLQLLLQPVLAQCGHAFCLSCADQLTMNKYCCSICHSHYPSYDLPASYKLQRLVNMYLRDKEEDRQNYDKRKKRLVENQSKRSAGVLTEGLLIDFWNQAELVWRTGQIEQINEQEAKIKDSKSGKYSTINVQSRGISKLHYFTEEEVPQERPNFENPRLLGRMSLLGINPFFSAMRPQQRMGSFFPMMYYLGGVPSEPVQALEPWNFIYQPPL